MPHIVAYNHTGVKAFVCGPRLPSINKHVLLKEGIDPMRYWKERFDAPAID